jgi:preprotein translocase subunit SecY
MLAAFWIIILQRKLLERFLFNMQKELLTIEFLEVKLLTLPVKVNISGVMPPIFASALLGFPATVSQFVPEGSISIKDYVDIFNNSYIQGRLFITLFRRIDYILLLLSTLRFSLKLKIFLNL